MQWALVGVKRLEFGSLLPLCLRHKQRVCPHIGIRGLPPQTSATADRNKGQFVGRIAIRNQNLNNANRVPGSIFNHPHANSTTTLGTRICERSCQLRVSQARCFVVKERNIEV